ncbi:hypothetical protein F5J12DRAFT_707881, partial [Pisolithus orientalis]|uniref:uncharacterized protein n=1 Tax=Pisolithus orientalis TaxID=936130 RepID=UPI00222405E9
LDVDSDIWQDVGIEEGYPDPLGWLADEGVCKGIRLTVDCCNEEERRLSREQTILQEWFSVEWRSVEAAQNNAVCHFLDACYKYHVQAQKDSLVETYTKWEAKVQHIPHAWPPSRPWGPTAEDIA